MKFLRYRGVCIECKSVCAANGGKRYFAVSRHFLCGEPARNGDSREVIARRKTAGALSGRQGARGQKPAQEGQAGWLFAAFEGQHACAPPAFMPLQSFTIPPAGLADRSISPAGRPRHKF